MSKKEEDKIDFFKILKKLLVNKRFIIKCSIIGAIIGLIIGFSIPKQYTTNVTLISDSGSNVGGGIGVLASMAGINLGGSMDSGILSADLYEDILYSTPFIQSLLDIHVTDPNLEINTSLYEYFRDHLKVPWWSYIFKIPKSIFGMIKSNNSINIEGSESNPKNSYYISEEELGIIASITSSISISFDKKKGITTVQVTTQSPIISAFLADTITSYLQTYIIEQRTKKAKLDLENSQILYDQAKNAYYDKQKELASFLDSNKNITSAVYGINQDKIQNETNLAYTLYTQMAQQVQINQLKVQNNTPVFTIIQPSVEPIGATTPNKKILLVVMILFTIFGSCIWTLREEFLGIK